MNTPTHSLKKIDNTQGIKGRCETCHSKDFSYQITTTYLEGGNSFFSGYYVCSEECFNMFLLSADSFLRRNGYIYAPWVPFYKTPQVILDEFKNKRFSNP